jgi:uncharacterized protein (TIRG00374 family)
MNKAMKKKIVFSLKIIISLSLLTYLLSKIEWQKSLITIQNANFLWITIAVILSLLDNMLLTYKWDLLLKVRGKLVSFWRLLAINMIGGFWGLFLPSSLSTDVIRGYYLIKTSSDKAISITSIFVDRLLALLALLVFVSAAMFFAGEILKDLHFGYYILGLFLFLGVVYIIFNNKKFSNLLQKLNDRFEDNKIISNIIKLRTALIEYKKYPLTLSLSFILSIVVQLFRVIWYITIAWAFGIHIPLVYYFIFCPLIIVILMIPVSIGGLGVREGAFVALFTIAGMSLDQAVIVSFTSSLITNIVTISGGIVYLFYRSEYKRNDSISLAESEINLNV